MEHTVALTAASSFTGLWIAQEFHRQGWKVQALSSQAGDNYKGLRALRVKLLRENVPLHFGVSAEGGSMAQWIRLNKPMVWVHHHHFMESFRSPDYDYNQAMRVGLQPLPEIMRALAESGCRGVIYSGSYFEPGEGGSGAPQERTPYARSKAVVWEALQRESEKWNLSLSKYVCPNPFGPFENEDRLIPAIIRGAKTRTSLNMTQPSVVADNLPVEYLAMGYVELAQALLAGKSQTLRPSGWVGTNGDWFSYVDRELVQQRLQLRTCPVQKGEAVEVAPVFRNPADSQIPVNWNQTWDHYSQWLMKTHALQTLF